MSTTVSNASDYKILDDLRIWLGLYIKRANLPVVIFAQLHSIGKRANKDLDSRIKDCPTIYEPATVVLEIIPCFNDLTSNFIIHKDRFGMAGTQIECGYEKGKFIDGAAFEKAKLDRLLGKTNQEEVIPVEVIDNEQQPDN